MNTSLTHPIPDAHLLPELPVIDIHDRDQVGGWAGCFAEGLGVDAGDVPRAGDRHPQGFHAVHTNSDGQDRPASAAGGGWVRWLDGRHRPGQEPRLRP